MGLLSGKRIVITGATGGQGVVACRMFCSHGATVLGTDLHNDVGQELERELAQTGHSFKFCRADLTSGTERENLRNVAEEWLGGIDVLYNNHGSILGKSFLDTTEDDWDLIVGIDLKSVFFLVQALVPLFSQSGGSIINTSSTAGQVAVPDMAAYAAAKGGLIMLTRSMAIDLASRSIRVNAICPGVIDTGMPREYVSKMADQDAVWQALVEGHVVGRLGKPEEVVSLAAFLASDHSAFMTGSIIPVDGGFTAK